MSRSLLLAPLLLLLAGCPRTPPSPPPGPPPAPPSVAPAAPPRLDPAWFKLALERTDSVPQQVTLVARAQVPTAGWTWGEPTLVMGLGGEHEVLLLLVPPPADAMVAQVTETITTRVELGPQEAPGAIDVMVRAEAGPELPPGEPLPLEKLRWD